MEEEANQLYRRPQMTGQARDEEEVNVWRSHHISSKECPHGKDRGPRQLLPANAVEWGDKSLKCFRCQLTPKSLWQ